MCRQDVIVSRRNVASAAESQRQSLLIQVELLHGIIWRSYIYMFQRFYMNSMSLSGEAMTNSSSGAYSRGLSYPYTCAFVSPKVNPLTMLCNAQVAYIRGGAIEVVQNEAGPCASVT